MRSKSCSKKKRLATMNEEITEKIHTIGGYSKYVKIPKDWVGDAKSVVIQRSGSKLVLEVEDK